MNFMLPRLKSLWAVATLAVAVLGFSTSPVRALGGTGYSTDAPTDDTLSDWETGWNSTSTGWNSVGQVSGGSGVYLGNGWVIAAAHEGITAGSTYTLNGVSYTVEVPIALTNSDGSAADLVMFQIGTVLNLPDLTISSRTPTAGTSVVMIGYGGGVESWGVNTITSTTDIKVQIQANDTTYTTTDFYTAYGSDTVRGVPYNNTIYFITGDSGGAGFTFNGTQWVLTGLNEAVGNQDPYTDDSFLIDLSQYSGEIDTIMATATPEPAAWALLGLGSVLLLVLCWRTRART